MERLALVERGPERTFTLKTQAELLSLNRSGLYYQAAPPSAEEVAIKQRIDVTVFERGHGSVPVHAQNRFKC